MGSGSKCGKCGQRFEGFLTDREKRKVWGVGILYISGFPILLLMIVVGALKASAPGEDNPNCPAEPNMPWFLVIGGTGIGLLLLFRICLVKSLRCMKNNQNCCDDVMGCFCEFGCNLIYDVMVMVMIILWLITVSWWVFRHHLGPQRLYSVLGKQGLDNFRASLGDNDTIHLVQFTDPLAESYCDQLLYMTTFILLTLGWVVLLAAFIVFLVDKIFSKLLCCRLCRNINHLEMSEMDDDQVHLNLTESESLTPKLSSR